MEADMRSVTRALSVLRELNINNGASILELHHATGISRPALYRIVRTLLHAGYLTADEHEQTYRLTPLVKHLSEGFDEDDWIPNVAGPVLDHLQRQVIWPTDLFTFFDDSMVMRRTTRRVSPWTIDRAIIGFRIPMLITACGRAYLANMPQAVAHGVIERLSRSDRPDDAMAHDPQMVLRLLRKVRQDGYALREKGFMKETGSIAVPVLYEGMVRCSIAVTYISSALSTKEVVERLAPLLREAAVEIEHDIGAKSMATKSTAAKR
jgi:IclR family transcriptional regulator, mhp operon transcriptional activator